MTERYGEWVPVREQLPQSDGLYETMIKPLLESARIVKVQQYTKQAHPAISGWQHMPVTHWRRLPS